MSIQKKVPSSKNSPTPISALSLPRYHPCLLPEDGEHLRLLLVVREEVAELAGHHRCAVLPVELSAGGLQGIGFT